MATLAGGQVPVRIEQGLRGTAAHSTLVLDDAKASAEQPANGSAAPPAGVSASPVSRDDETVVESVWKAHAVKATSRGDSRSLATRTGACANRPCLCSLCCSV